ncbi:hypothetical protein E0L16_03165 [Enterobacter quasihormaechei]|uniref:Uncharacterized protein n=1 Tax=Enterobacter quasihormaechei TaxID=2529382 RepID=A0AAE8UDB4_9ENTR|nr:hypothetical protein E0L16_03165 [Enterobacter quasihormaechei]
MRSTFGSAFRAFRSSTDIRTSFACFAGRHCVCPAYKPVGPVSEAPPGKGWVIPRNPVRDRAPGE